MTDFLHELDWVVPLRNDALDPVFYALTLLGIPKFFFLVLPFVFLFGNKGSSYRITVTLLTATLCSFFLKAVFQDPRPDDSFRILIEAPDSFGLPSAHTLLAICFWGMLAIESGKRWLKIAVVPLVFGIAASRLYLGVHDPEDILGGLIVGGVILTGARIWIYRSTRSGVEGRSRSRISEGAFWMPIALSLAFPVLLVLLWPAARDPSSLTLGVCGFLPGFVIGRQIEMRWMDAKWEASWKRFLGIPVLAFLLGILYLMAIFVKQIWILGSVAGLIFSLLLPASLVALSAMKRSCSQQENEIAKEGDESPQ